jgi:transposase-like protein
MRTKAKAQPAKKAPRPKAPTKAASAPRKRASRRQRIARATTPASFSAFTNRGTIRKSNAGRKCTLTPQVEQAICHHMRAGHYLEHAAALAGVSESTVRTWLRQAEADIAAGDDSTPFVHFAVELKRAVAVAIDEDLKSIRGRRYNWQANAWVLERRHPSLFGPHSKIEHMGEGGGPVRHTYDLSKLSTEELRALTALVKKTSMPVATNTEG